MAEQLSAFFASVSFFLFKFCQIRSDVFRLEMLRPVEHRPAWQEMMLASILTPKILREKLTDSWLWKKKCRSLMMVREKGVQGKWMRR
jgi:hypothetical protein